jgi:hypothetical protein
MRISWTPEITIEILPLEDEGRVCLHVLGTDVKLHIRGDYGVVCEDLARHSDHQWAIELLRNIFLAYEFKRDMNRRKLDVELTLELLTSMTADMIFTLMIGYHSKVTTELLERARATAGAVLCRQIETYLNRVKEIRV